MGSTALLQYPQEVGAPARNGDLPPNITLTRSRQYQVQVGPRDQRFCRNYASLEVATLVAQRESLRHKYSVVMSYRNDPRLTAVIDVLEERLKNQAQQLRPMLVTHNLL